VNVDLDRVLAGGSVVDGTGARAYRADVGVRGGRIAAIGDLAGAPAGERLDVAGRVVCPGFIDFGSDGWVATPSGPLAEGKPHPRSYGTYPRILGHYVREAKLFGLEEAVHKAAYRPAERLGLREKGRVQVGADADLVVFDPATVRDEATYTDPHRFPTGIEHVWVAGEPTIRAGRHTGARAGRVLRRP
jgi:N-acyl-D-aspartate/D-glutamate deacylase